MKKKTKVVKTSKADIECALHAIALIPQAYNAHGAEFCRDKMAEVAREALAGEWAGVAQSPEADRMLDPQGYARGVPAQDARCTCFAHKDGWPFVHSSHCALLDPQAAAEEKARSSTSR